MKQFWNVPGTFQKPTRHVDCRLFERSNLIGHDNWHAEHFGTLLEHCSRNVPETFRKVSAGNEKQFVNCVSLEKLQCSKNVPKTF